MRCCDGQQLQQIPEDLARSSSDSPKGETASPDALPPTLSTARRTSSLLPPRHPYTLPHHIITRITTPCHITSSHALPLATLCSVRTLECQPRHYQPPCCGRLRKPARWLWKQLLERTRTRTRQIVSFTPSRTPITITPLATCAQYADAISRARLITNNGISRKAAAETVAAAGRYYHTAVTSQ
jgi:hypothetical protein